MTNEQERNEGYPAAWVRLVLMVSPTGEYHSIGGDGAPGADPAADCELPGMARLRKRFGAALASQVVQEPVAWMVEDGSGYRGVAFIDPQTAEGAYDGYTITPLYAAPLAAGGPDSFHLTARSGEAATGREDGGGVLEVPDGRA